MSKYKQAMIKKGIMQKELLDGVRKADARVDKPLLSKIVNDICLPNRVTLKSICNVLQCEPLDIYEKDEINLAGGGGQAKTKIPRRKISRRKRLQSYRRTRSRFGFACFLEGVVAVAWLFKCNRRNKAIRDKTR